MSMKKIAGYLLYLLGFLLLVFYYGKFQMELRILAGREFNPLPPIVFNSLYSILMGMYIALPKLISALIKTGRLRLDWQKLLIIGIPTLLISTSGILYHYVTSDLTLLFQWIYIKLIGTVGNTFIGVACGYTLLSSINKEEINELPAKKIDNTGSIDNTGNNRIAKIATLVIAGAFVLYILLNGVIHPVKLADVKADIVTTDNQSGYLVNEGKETVYFINTDITYTFQFENMPHSQRLSLSGRDRKIWIEPTEKLENLLEEDLFKQQGGAGFSSSGNKTEITLTYNLGSIDPAGSHPDKQPPPPEVLAEIKDALYETVLVIQFDETKIKRFNLLEYTNEHVDEKGYKEIQRITDLE